MNTREAERDYRDLEDFLFRSKPNFSKDTVNDEIIGWIDYNPETGEETFRENPNYKSNSDYKPQN